jgi:hypothetical protein
MLGLDMLAALVEAMRHCHVQAGLMAALTGRNAVVHRRVLQRRSAHGEYPLAGEISIVNRCRQWRPGCAEASPDVREKKSAKGIVKAPT